MKSVLLTLVTINYNNAEGLRRTLQSLKGVISDEVESLIIDGNSTDGSKDEIAARLNESIYSRALIESDTGIYDAMNKGWRNSKGRFIAYINSGDEIIPATYHKFIEGLRSSDADVVYAKTLIRSEDGLKERVHEKHPADFSRSTIPHLTAAVRRSIFERVGGFDERYRVAADRDFFLRIYKNGAKFEFCDSVTTIFYEGGASSSRATRLEDINISYRHSYMGTTRFLIKVALFYVQSLLRSAASTLRARR